MAEGPPNTLRTPQNVGKPGPKQPPAPKAVQDFLKGRGSRRK